MSRLLSRAGLMLAGALLAAWLTGPLPAAAAAESPAGQVAALPPAALFFSPPKLQDALLSPSGDRLALTVPGSNGRLGLFVIDLRAANFAASRAAYYADVDIGRVAWVDDERLLFTLFDSHQPAAERRRLGGGLVVTRHDGSEQRLLIEREGRSFITNGSVRSNTLPRSHGLLYVPHAEPGTGESTDDDLPRAGEVVVGRGIFDRGELAQVLPLLLDVRNGRTREIELRGTPDGAISWWFTPRGTPRLVFARVKGRDALHWREVPVAGQPARWRRLAEAAQGRLPFWPVWVGEGDQL